MTLFGRTIELAAFYLAVSVLGLLVVATIVGQILKLRASTEKSRRTVDNLNARTNAWWVMAAVFGGAIALGPLGACILFAFVSFFCLREMITLAPTRRADHHTLFWAFFVVIPVQYYLVYIKWYGLYSIFIPVYVFLFLAIRSTFAGDATRYMERTAKVQWGVMICVYCISHAAGLLTLDLPYFTGQGWKLLVFLVLVVQLSDVFQYVWGKLLGRRKIAPHLSPNKTVEGFVGGILTAATLGTALYKLTPFTLPEAAGMALLVALLGFAGGIVMSAVKRDVGIKDYGHLIEGHGGMMDRVDSLTFAAPVFFHLVRYLHGTPPT